MLCIYNLHGEVGVINNMRYLCLYCMVSIYIVHIVFYLESSSATDAANVFNLALSFTCNVRMLMFLAVVFCVVKYQKK